jgi:type II restriction/modification system DNA methylase subunit YeeA
MNTSALKTFAPAVRTQLIEAVTRKLDYVLTADTADLRAMSVQRESLRREATANRAGLIDRVAYTWFNRLTALRFLDARGWHAFRARVLTAASAEESQPELLKVTRAGALPPELVPYTQAQRLNDLLDGRIPSPDAQGEVYRHLVLAACRFYHALLPNLFEKLDDETELLLPDDLLTEHSVVHGFRTEISDEDCGDGQRANVEILGWLYQFYISERKDQVMARKSAVPTEDIPAVTQLFTPHWIVRYLVENSLGRLWLLNRPGSRLREHMPYYIEGEKNATGGSPDDFLKITKPEEIRLCDPAVGSAHMLTYAFDLLTLIYEEEGYAPTEIPALILRHNLHGLEICPRAAQLAELALVFKAREKSRRFFQPEHLVRPHIIELQNITFAEGELADYFKAIGINPSSFIPHTSSFPKLLHQFEEAKNFGSLIQPCLDERAIVDVRRAIEAKDLGGQLFLRETHLKVLRVLEQAEALTQRYHVVVANPPYLGNGAMNPLLKNLVEKQYEPYKSDLFSAFIERGLLLARPNGFAGFMSPFVWMFVSSFEDLRARLTGSATLTSLIQLEYSGFAEATVPICCFVALNGRASGSKTAFIRLADFKGPALQEPKTLEAIRNKECGWFYRVDPHKFVAIEGRPICFWASDGVFDAFEKGRRLDEFAVTRKGMATGDNGRFVREWFEVNGTSIGFGLDRAGAKDSDFAWFPYANGGAFRKWFGNDLEVVNWENDGQLLQTERHHTGRIRAVNLNLDYIFLPGLSWTSITSSRQSYRLMPKGCLFSSAANSMFPKSEDTLWELLAFLNSDVAEYISKCLNPTLNANPGDVSRLPMSRECLGSRVARQTAKDAIALARADWDNFETSWDFRDQPLLRPGLKGATLEASWRNWEAQSTAAIRRMQELETENNRLFIAAYGLDGELQPEVPEAQITLARAEARRDMAAFLSYAVGCMMGRYGLDHPGLILANAGDSLRDFLEKVGKPLTELTFAPDEDGIIPVLDGEWFEDDIVARTRDFLRATFGEATLNENIRFIEESLGKDLRKYFQTDFCKNHLQTYKKRPIYWLFRSPKGAFAALVYLHRMTRDTPNLVLNRYLRNYLVKLRARIEHLDHAQAVATTAKEKTAARKESDQLKKNLRECEEWERDVLLPLAQSRPELDLDDGVKVNYLKLGDALAPIPGLAAAEEE